MSCRSEAALAARPSLPAAFWTVVLGSGAALLDLGLAASYFGAHGVPAERVFQSIASWLMGPAAYRGGDATVIFGGLLYVAVLSGVIALYPRLARHLPVMRRRPLAVGAAYGALAYGLIFLLLVPYASAAHPASHPLQWHALCVLAYALLVGIPAAWRARDAAR